MRLEQLRYLRDIEQTKSLSKTGARFYISPQALSKSMHQLETEMGIQLLFRSPFGVTLTEEGKRFVDEASNFIDRYDLLKQEFQEQQAKNISPDCLPKIRIGISSMFASILLPKVIAQYHQKYPKQQITIEEITCDEVFPSLREGRYDIVFLSLHATMFNQAWNLSGKNNHRYNLLISDKLVACVSSTSPLAKKEQITLDELFISYRTSLGLNDTPRGRAIKESYGFNNHDKCIYAGNNIDFHRDAMKQFGAVTLMPRFVFQKAFNNKQFTARYVDGMDCEIYHTAIYADTNPHPQLCKFVNIMQSLI